MSNNESILAHCTSGGCGAKIGPGELSSILSNIPLINNEHLIVGYDSSDDAAVYTIDETRSLIATVDFFSPMVDDPYTFGCIAAANALSDVYAMGGNPALVLNLVCFPEKLPKKILGEILQGGAEKIKEAGAVIGGGHSIYDKELKYGLSVTGFADTKNIIRNNTPKVGDCLILTKPLGVGIVMAALRGEVASTAAVEQALNSMKRLNKYAAEKMQKYTINACTDITGFGLLAHLLEMCGDTVSACINTQALPVIPEAVAYANEFLVTAAGQRNRNHFSHGGNIESVSFALQELMFDPQTSGGLLISVDKKDAHALLDDIKQDDSLAQIIGTIVESHKEKILFTENM